MISGDVLSSLFRQIYNNNSYSLLPVVLVLSAASVLPLETKDPNETANRYSLL